MACQEQQGVGLVVTLGGQLQSPMRAELCGAIVAVGGGVPNKLAADNAVVVKRDRS